MISRRAGQFGSDGGERGSVWAPLTLWSIKFYTRITKGKKTFSWHCSYLFTFHKLLLWILKGHVESKTSRTSIPPHSTETTYYFKFSAACGCSAGLHFQSAQGNCKVVRHLNTTHFTKSIGDMTFSLTQKKKLAVLLERKRLASFFSFRGRLLVRRTHVSLVSHWNKHRRW